MTKAQEKAINQLVNLAEELSKETKLKGLGLFFCKNCGKIVVIDNKVGNFKSKFCSRECQDRFIQMRTLYHSTARLKYLYDLNADYFDEDLAKLIQKISQYKEE